ncbi:MAG: hypothetical protein V2A67_01375 [Bacteroidota bacterium]
MKQLLILFLAFLGSSASAQTEIDVLKIWDSAPHNAFTDLVRYKGSFYCTFREGVSHVPKGRPENGKIRILKSPDCIKWKSVALLENEQYDLRDPKISVTPDERLMVIMGGSDYTTGSLLGCLTHVSFSQNGKDFSAPQPVEIEPSVKTDYDWIWRITWKDGIGYGVVYQPHQPDGEFVAQLLKTSDGIRYKLISKLDVKGKPNEATVRFDGDRIYIVIRREGPGTNGVMGVSNPPYQSWVWIDLGMKVGGPDFIFIGPDRIAMGTRLYRSDDKGGVKTGIVYMNSAGLTDHIVDLPSGGDTSYPGMVMYHGTLYISYYSSHENKTSIYLARIDIKDQKK